MAGTFAFELVSPEKLLISEPVDEVIAPGTEGEFTVLPGHAPFLSTLKPGLVRVKANGTTRSLFVRGGFAEVNPQGLTILAEQAIPLEALDAARFEAEIADAQAHLKNAIGEDARIKAEANINQLLELRAALSAGTATAH